MKGAISAVTAALLLSTAGGATATSDSDDAMQRLERVEEALEQQRVHYEHMLQQQRDEFERRLEAVAAGAATTARRRASSGAPHSSVVDRSGRGRRMSSYEDYSGLFIARRNAGITMGNDSDVGLFRTDDGELTLAANVAVDGDLWLTGVKQTVQAFIEDAQDRLMAVEFLAGNTTEHLLEVEALAKRETLAKASSWFPAGSTEFGTYTIKQPFGKGNSDVVFDFPITAEFGSGRMVDGTFTAPVDGVYFMTTEIRIQDDSTTSVEIEFMLNSADYDNFEMWVPEGDFEGRRTAVSSILVPMAQGDTLYPMSDITPGTMKAQTDVFQLRSDRIAFMAWGTGTMGSTGVPLNSLVTEADKFVVPAEFSSAYSSTTGIFTAPRAGVYYFVCKMRTSDSTSGDIEVEWQVNGNDTDGSFEMWLHSGDFYPRRAQTSAMLVELDEGDTVYPTTDLSFTTSGNIHFSGFELSQDVPCFKVVSTDKFTYSTANAVIGDGASTSVLLERGSEDAIADGVYTVPKTGVYYFTMKLRTLNAVESDIGIEFKINGEDAAHNMVMWLHQGDSTGRRSGMSTTMIRLEAGDEVSAVSPLGLASSSDYIAQWTFSGFMVE